MAKIVFRSQNRNILIVEANKILLSTVLIIFVGIFYSSSAWGYLSSLPMPTTEMIGQSQCIVVARVIQFTADSESSPSADSPETQSHDALLNIMPAGEYELSVFKVIRGQSEKTLKLHFPALLKYNYSFTDIKVEQGSFIILFLAKNQDGQLAPVEPSIPLVQLSEDSASAAISAPQDVTTTVLELMLRSLNDPAIREADTALLRDVNNPLMVQALSPFLNDTNERVRDNVLSCLAVNQFISAIPKITQLEAKQARQGGGTYCVTKLEAYTDPKAIPLLNPLLFESDEYIRVNAIMALRKIADVSSIPYLILALHDPDPQNLVPYTAYLTLHRIVPKLPKDADDFDYTKPIPEKDLLPIYNWWNDELMGIHFHPEEQMDGKNPKQMAGKVEQANLALFNPDKNVRLKSIKLLTTDANSTSIPFLILALQDPDNNVAYQSYKVLHHLLPVLGQAKGSIAFNADRKAVSQPVYKWWRDELLGKHLPKSLVP